MRYMIDFHGVIDHRPNYFKKITEDLISCGNEIFICTGSKKNIVLVKLNNLGFQENKNFNEIFSISDILEETLPAAEIEYDNQNNIWVDDMLWWPMKGMLCEQYHIDIIIDDSEEYFIYVPNNTIKLYYHKNNKNFF